MESVFGLPAHPMFIHAPVVLVPLSLIVALAMFRGSWRRQYRVPLLALTGGSVVTTFMARESGEAFDDLLQGAVDVSKHESLANWTMLFVVLMFIAAIVLFVLDRRSAAPGDSGVASGAVTGALAVTVVLGVLGTIWMIRTGHEGANLVWSGTIRSE